MPVHCSRSVFNALLQCVVGGCFALVILLANPSAGRTQTAQSNVQNPEAIGGGLFIAGSSLYVAAWGYGLQVLDISTPTQPRWVGAWNQRGAPTGIYVVERYAYVANRPCGLEILDVHDPRNPVSLANLRTGGDAMGVFVKGQFAYMADGVHVTGAQSYSYMPGGNKGLKVIDIKIPQQPQLLSAPSQQTPVGVGVADVVNLDRIVYENIAEYAAIPSLRRVNAIAAGMTGFYVSGNLAYSTAGRSGLRIYDVSDANQPMEICNFKTPYGTWDVRVAGKYAYLMDSGTSIHVLDVSDSAKPQEVGQFSCTGYVSRWIALEPIAANVPRTSDVPAPKPADTVASKLPTETEVAANSPPTPGVAAPEIKPIDTAPPQLINPRRLADGSFKFTLVGVASGRYVIQFTSDWGEWTNLSTNSLSGNGFATIADPHAAEATQRYYRAVMQ
jgi:hypothetical protein